MGDNFNENLKYAREKKGLSQKEVAEGIGVAKSTYSLYESGNREPNVQTIKKIADVLNVSADDLLGINETPILPAAHFDGTEFTENELDEIKQFAEFVKSNRKNDVIEPHFTNVQEALSYINQETALVAAFNGKIENEDAIIQMANAIHMNRTKE